MRRLSGRALLLLAAYAAVILAVVIAAFIGQRVGIWASVLWGVVLIGGVALCITRRRRDPQIDT
jgi:type IV secretory pathway TrbD component